MPPIDHPAMHANTGSNSIPKNIQAGALKALRREVAAEVTALALLVHVYRTLLSKQVAGALEDTLSKTR